MKEFLFSIMRTIYPQHNVIPVPHILFHFTAVGYDPSGVLMTRQASSERQYLLKKRCPVPNPRQRRNADVGQRSGGAQLTGGQASAARALPPTHLHHPRVLPTCTSWPCAPGRMPACPAYPRALCAKPLPPRMPFPRRDAGSPEGRGRRACVACTLPGQMPTGAPDAVRRGLPTSSL